MQKLNILNIKNISQREKEDLIKLKSINSCFKPIMNTRDISTEMWSKCDIFSH